VAAFPASDPSASSSSCFTGIDEAQVLIEHLAGRADWLEPFQSWILPAKNAGEIAVLGSLQEQRALASKVFGSNFVLDRKKPGGSCVKPWSLIPENSQTGGMVPRPGLEPGTN
jgi:hypothetical protein